MTPSGGTRPGAGRPGTGKDPSLTIRLPPKLLAQVWATAEDEGLTVSEWLRGVIEREMED